MGIAENIKLLRKKANLTQKQLAEKAGLSIGTIQGYEQGKYEPKNEALYKLRKALDCNIYEILEKVSNDTIDDPNAIIIENIEDLAKKFKELTGTDLVEHRKKSENSLEIFLCYIESLGYKTTFLDTDEMKDFHIPLESENDFYIGIENIELDNVTFFHKSEFENLQKELEKTLDYEIYKQFTKIPEYRKDE